MHPTPLICMASYISQVLIKEESNELIQSTRFSCLILADLQISQKKFSSNEYFVYIFHKKIMQILPVFILQEYSLKIMVKCTLVQYGIIAPD